MDIQVPRFDTYGWLQEFRNRNGHLLGGLTTNEVPPNELCFELANQLRKVPEFSWESQKRLESVARALLVFWTHTHLGNIKDLYGTNLVRSICHAVFGADLRPALFAGPQQARRILIIGDTGTGKEAVAKLIAETLQALEDDRRDLALSKKETFKTINAAGFTDSLLEAELFGAEKGAFTGANEKRKGIISTLSDGSVLFLDEVGEAGLTMQASLLRLVQSGEYRPVGATEIATKRFHLVAATNRPEEDLRSGNGFRKDLFFRLACPAINLPTMYQELCERDESARVKYLQLIIEDVFNKSFPVIGLSEQVAGERNRWKSMTSRRLAREVYQGTKNYRWPGNLRECSGFIERVLYQGIDALPKLCGQLIENDPRLIETGKRGSSGTSLHQRLLAEESRIYEEVAANFATIEEVAKQLGVTRQTASRRMKVFGLTPQGERRSAVSSPT